MPVTFGTILSTPPVRTLLSAIGAIKDELTGGGTIELEIPDATITRCFADAVLALNSMRPQRAWAGVPFVVGQRIELDYPNVKGIVNVQISRGTGCDDRCGGLGQALMVVTPFGGFSGLRPYAGLFGLNGALSVLMPGDMPSDLYQIMQERAAAVPANKRPDWAVRVDPTNNKKYLYVDAPSGSLVAIQYTYNATADDDSITGLWHLTETDYDWVKRYALAKAKQALGRVLRKHGGVNMPDGSVEQLDGEQLMDEGRADEQALREELKGRRRPLLPEVG